jgi:hypothetical protein
MFCKTESCKKQNAWFPFVHFYLNDNHKAVGYSISWIFDPEKEIGRDIVGGKKFEKYLNTRWCEVQKEVTEIVMTRTTKSDKNILLTTSQYLPTQKSSYLDSKENPIVISLLKTKPNTFKLKFTRDISIF